LKNLIRALYYLRYWIRKCPTGQLEDYVQHPVFESHEEQIEFMAKYFDFLTLQDKLIKGLTDLQISHIVMHTPVDDERAETYKVEADLLLRLEDSFVNRLNMAERLIVLYRHTLPAPSDF
jgi:hypothetical protein